MKWNGMEFGADGREGRFFCVVLGRKRRLGVLALFYYAGLEIFSLWLFATKHNDDVVDEGLWMEQYSKYYYDGRSKKRKAQQRAG